MLELTLIKTTNAYTSTLSEFDIWNFICNVDPCNMMDDIWLEKHVEFMESIQKNIINQYTNQHRFESDGYTVKQIKKFYDTFDEYTNYIARHMNMSEANTNYLIPLRVIRNNPSAWRKFTQKVMSYREKLRDINDSIYKHLRII